MIQIQHYGTTVAVDNLSFEIRPGQVTGFLGPNGAGKSTIMRMMEGLDQPTAGHVTIDGHRYRNLRFPLRHVGALLEAKPVHPARSARNHLRWLADSNDIDRRRGGRERPMSKSRPPWRTASCSQLARGTGD